MLISSRDRILQVSWIRIPGDLAASGKRARDSPFEVIYHPLIRNIIGGCHLNYRHLGQKLCLWVAGSSRSFLWLICKPIKIYL